MNEDEIRHEVCRVGRSLFERGYVHATAGNISFRLDDGFLITPTDACLGDLQPGDLARIDAQGVQKSGSPASKTFALHRAIYDSVAAGSPRTRCIIHTHSTHCVALTLRSPGPELLDALTPYFVMKVGRVPVVPYVRPGAATAAAAAAQVIEAYATRGLPIRAVVFERLGPNVWHETPAQAMAVLEELEETARLRCLVQGDVAPLRAEELTELREAFGACW